MRLYKGIKYVLRPLSIMLYMWTFPYRPYMVKKQCIFIHIPKVAGTSILSVLGHNKGRDHLPWYVYYTANPIRFERYYKFAFVRNPWERVYSAYCYLRSGGNKQSDLKLAKILKQYSTFNEFVVKGLGKGLFRNHLMFIPQSYFILGQNGVPVVNFLGRYERLQNDFEKICDRLEISSNLPQLNKSPQQINDFREAYSSTESIGIVEEIYKQDVKVFGYRFE